MRNLVIFGTGGHAAVVRDCIDPACFSAIGYIDDLAEKGTKIDGLPVLGGVADLPAILAEHPLLAGVIGIGANHVRRIIAKKAERLCPSLEWSRIIHPSAIISPRAGIGAGTVIVAGAVVNTRAQIGQHVIINTGSNIDHDNMFADYSSTGPGVSTGGSVRLGTCSHIGIGTSVRHGVSIGDYSVIGGQSFVNRDIGDHKVAYGIPVREVRERSADAAYL